MNMVLLDDFLALSSSLISESTGRITMKYVPDVKLPWGTQNPKIDWTWSHVSLFSEYVISGHCNFTKCFKIIIINI